MDREQLAQRLQRLHESANDGDWSGVEEGLRELDDAKTTAFAQGIRKMARDLYAEMRALQLDNRLARAAAEIPDACSRLDAVIELTEQAATRTMDLVEDSRDHIVALQELGAGVSQPDVAEQLEQRTALLRKNMSSLYEAQSYQDLSGQIIRRVMTMVGNLDATLKEMLELAGVSPLTLEQAGDELLGPAAGRTDNRPAASQDDADALLADLGI